MPRTKVGEVSAAKEARLNLRLTPSLDKRLAVLSAMSGESKTSIGGAAMVIGLRLLEQSIMGPELAASSLEELGEQLRSEIEADVDTVVAEAAERDAKRKPRGRKPKVEPIPEPEPDRIGIGFKPRGELDDDDMRVWTPTVGYMAGL